MRPALNLWVATLHRIKVQRRRIGAGGHRAGGAAPHADAHAGAAQLDQQAAGGEFDLVSELGVNRAQATSNHDGLVVAPANRVHIRRGGLLVLAEITQQVRAAKLVVERRTAQGAFGHDLQGAGDVGRAAIVLRRTGPEFGHGKTGQPGLRLRATAGRTFVADLTARAGRGTGERRDRSGVVVGFYLHQHMVDRATFFIAIRRRIVLA